MRDVVGVDRVVVGHRRIVYRAQARLARRNRLPLVFAMDVAFVVLQDQELASVVAVDVDRPVAVVAAQGEVGT